MEEKIRGVFPIDVGGTFFSHYWDMYFTDKRIVTNFVGRGVFPRSTNKIMIPIGGWVDWFIIRPLLKSGKQNPSSDMDQ
ncbi:hypothetical protein ACFLWV_03765, partial [Chloroflexota bacterium]